MTYDLDDETDWDYDDWYDDEQDQHGYEKTEPDCHNRDCYDSGFVTDQRGRERRCTWCNPGRARYALRRLGWRVTDAFRRFRARRVAGPFDDEAPF